MNNVYLNVFDLALYLSVKESTVRKWVLLRKIPFVKIGKLVRFKKTEIDSWLADCQRKNLEA